MPDAVHSNTDEDYLQIVSSDGAIKWKSVEHMGGEIEIAVDLATGQQIMGVRIHGLARIKRGLLKG